MNRTETSPEQGGEQSVREAGAGGSNPLTPTNNFKHLGQPASPDPRVTPGVIGLLWNFPDITEEAIERWARVHYEASPTAKAAPWDQLHPAQRESAVDRLWKMLEAIALETPPRDQRIVDLLRANNALVERARTAEAEVRRLTELVNTPQTAEFLDSVGAEAAHQRQRWGEAHDRSKSAENWYWLVGYLAGKALRAAIEGDQEKAKHHTISSGAALLHWHAAISDDASGSGAGQDLDLKSIAGDAQ